MRPPEAAPGGLSCPILSHPPLARLPTHISGQAPRVRRRQRLHWRASFVVSSLRSLEINTDSRPLLLIGGTVGLSAMRMDDVPIIARWNQDLEFTARIGTPGEAHTLEMRQDAFNRNSKFRPDGAEFAVIELANGRFVGFGGLRDITHAMVRLNLNPKLMTPFNKRAQDCPSFVGHRKELPGVFVFELDPQ